MTPVPGDRCSVPAATSAPISSTNRPMASALSSGGVFSPTLAPPACTPKVAKA